MKLKLPKDWSGVTVGEFINLLPYLTTRQETFTMYEALKRKTDILTILSGLDRSEVAKISQEKADYYLEKCTYLSERPDKGHYKKRFKLLGVWYEVDPNAKKLSGGQYIRSMQILKDLSNDPDTIDKNIHLILANVIKPMKRNGLKLEALTEYDIADLSKTFYDALPISIAYPIIVFFCSLSKALIPFMEDYSRQKIKETESQLLTIQKDLQNSSDGI